MIKNVIYLSKVELSVRQVLSEGTFFHVSANSTILPASISPKP